MACEIADTRGVAVASLDVVRSIYDGWQRGDFSREDWAHPEIDFVYVGGPEPAAGTGIAAMNELWGEWLRDWVDFRAVPLEYRVLEEDRILVLVRNLGRGRLSGVDLDERSVGNYFELEDGLVRRLVVYLDGARALADLGLEA